MQSVCEHVKTYIYITVNFKRFKLATYLDSQRNTSMNHNI